MSTPTPLPFALDIPGTWNARDVGGRATPRGGDRPLATGVLLRTASLSKVTDAGLGVLRQLDVSTVCDLRGDDEVARDGADRVPDGTRVRRRAMDPTAGSGRGPSADAADAAVTLANLVGADEPAVIAARMMQSVYRTFVTNPDIRTQVGHTLTDIAFSDGAAVVHCSAGKDRTGWIVALVQYLCGIDEDDRMAEYLDSAAGAEALAATLPSIPGLDPSALLPLLTVAPDYLNGAWSSAVDEFGSMDAYLVACGLDEATRQTLVGRLVG